VNCAGPENGFHVKTLSAEICCQLRAQVAVGPLPTLRRPQGGKELGITGPRSWPSPSLTPRLANLFEKLSFMIFSYCVKQAEKLFSKVISKSYFQKLFPKGLKIVFRI
jgi:hypothetical protein